MLEESQFSLLCYAVLGETVKRAWTRGEKITAGAVGVASLAAIAAWIVVPKLRHTTGLEPPASEVTASKPGRVVGVFAASIEELRVRNHVTLIPSYESDKTLAEIPAGSYAFVFGPYIAHSPSNALQMYTHNNPAYFEVHKLTGSQTEFAGYVGSETKERLRKGLGKGEKLTLYSAPWQKAPNLTAISFGSVKCTRSRDLAVRRKVGAIVLFALDCKAI